MGQQEELKERSHLCPLRLQPQHKGHYIIITHFGVCLAYLLVLQLLEMSSPAIVNLVMSLVPRALLDMTLSNLMAEKRECVTSWQQRAKDVVHRGVLLSQSLCEVFCLRNSIGLGFLTIKCKNGEKKGMGALN